ncbi:fungal-specific transcription factor domain-containing protein [Bombardia bombarda]|uniref:Fungal-specific transcription factor domain-containing protein n=1 Tax=Bombardia bombarda TaxID=252184 RepID=A0AA39XI81_9PEZI|nr:fungal-specific transcription factor domain-containing protein [Bombardia bombarda]
MLLYTRRALPKEPKKRSRAGCTHCKEKKKKCDEERPQCSRCAEHGTTCSYEIAKPRKRRKRASTLSLSTASETSRDYLSARRLSEVSHDGHHANRPATRDGDYGHTPLGDFDDFVAISPTDSMFGGASFTNFSLDFATGPESGITPSGFLIDLYEEEEEEANVVGPQIHHEPGTIAIVSRSAAQYPDLAMIAPCPVTSPLMEFYAPVFSEFSERPNRRALVDHFCNVLSHLIVFREESGNPFQQLVLPLTRQSSPVMNAIYALASAHLEYRGINNMEKSLYFHNRAIQGLARLIEQNDKTNRNEILASIMLLVYYEVLVQRGQSNIVDGHLKGALTVMCTHPEQSDPTGTFLERAFRFYDVITALSNGTAPLSAAPAPGCLLPLPPLGALAASPLSNVDSLLGMATTLWPIIHRLSSMLSLKSELESAVQANAMSSKIAVLRTEFESTAEAIEAALTQWRPHLPPNFVPDEEEIKDPTFDINKVAEFSDDRQSSRVEETAVDEINLPNNPITSVAAQMSPAERGRIHSILHNALAYRHSAFVYLYRTIYTYPRSHDVVQAHVHLALMHCVATVCHAGPMGALLWPLFVAACEAVDLEDRGLAKRAFDAIKKRQGMMNIERAWDIVHEVWRRADLAEGSSGLGCVGDRGHDGGETDGVVSGRGINANGKSSSSKSSHSVCNDDGSAAVVVPADIWRQVSRDMGVNIVFG